MSLSIEEALGQRLLLAFRGSDRLPDEILQAIRAYRPGGFTLFTHFNVESPSQVRRLTAMLQGAARENGLPAFLIGADQEGGQLMAVAKGATLLPGNMALGAAADADLSRRAGEVLGSELAAMGINVNYAPSCDVNVNPRNPVIGIRSFGEDPQAVAELAAAMIEGIQSRGVAATAKHFPGHGDTGSDSHHGVPVVPHPYERLRQVELPPFEAAVQAGVKLFMTAHLALPAITGDETLPATLSSEILQGLLRRELGFEGLIVTDAMDMHAIRQGPALGAEAVRAAAAGADLLLLTSSTQDHQRVHAALLEAARGEPGAQPRLDADEIQASAGRVLALKRWLAAQAPQPDLSVVGCAEHREVAQEIAARSVTLVRDRRRHLPLQLSPGQRLAVIQPRPVDLTPADTSSLMPPCMAQAMRGYHPEVDEYLIPYAPQPGDIAAVLDGVADCAAVVVGTLNAFAQPGQAALVEALLGMGLPLVWVGLRLPYDIMACPEASTYLCTYSILEPSMHALASVIFGGARPIGRLPVSIPGLYATGFTSETDDITL